ncbi:MAG: sulfite exporter TauE/SafE family protein [Clostridia bacterium]|nr:sulfite exporter TauE/SafE family protein [Clostridia bacterium]
MVEKNICSIYDMGRSEVAAEMTVYTALAGFLSGIIGAMGMGGGGVLLIYLTVFAGVGQIEAQGTNLLFFLPIGLLAIITYAIKKQIRWKTVLFMWLGGIFGAVLGYFVAELIGSERLSKSFAVFLIFFGIIQLLSGFKFKKVITGIKGAYK